MTLRPKTRAVNASTFKHFRVAVAVHLLNNCAWFCRGATSGHISTGCTLAILISCVSSVPGDPACTAFRRALFPAKHNCHCAWAAPLISHTTPLVLTCPAVLCLVASHDSACFAGCWGLLATKWAASVAAARADVQCRALGACWFPAVPPPTFPVSGRHKAVRCAILHVSCCLVGGTADLTRWQLRHSATGGTTRPATAHTACCAVHLLLLLRRTRTTVWCQCVLCSCTEAV